jgi:hypothetical protein
MNIDDPNLEAVESEKDKEIQNYTGHSLDKETGYYNTSIDKLKKCEIRGKMFPYISNSFIQYLPKYKEFFAAKVIDYISSNKINEISYSNDKPTHFCNQDYTPPPETETTPVSKIEEQDNLKDSITQKSTSNKNDKNDKNDTSNNNKDQTESYIHKYICKIINYKYFDAIYLLISFIIGLIIYFIFYYETKNEIKPTVTLSNDKNKNNSDIVPVSNIINESNTSNVETSSVNTPSIST